MECVKCNKAIDNDSKFCEFCGNKIKDLQNKTSKLKEKAWYRMLQVVYLTAITSWLFFAAINTFSSIHDFLTSESIFFLCLIFITLVLAEIIKRSFYYIYFGKLFPNRD